MYRLVRHGRVAQLAEHTPEKRGVTGSTPVSTTEQPLVDHLIARGFVVPASELATLSVFLFARVARPNGSAAFDLPDLLRPRSP